MKAAVLSLLLAAPAAAGFDPEAAVAFEADLTALVHEAVLADPDGAELAGRLQPAGLPPVYLDDKDVARGRSWGAYYKGGRVFLNEARALRSLGLGGLSYVDAPWGKLRRDRARLRRLALEVSADYFHELVHAAQYRRLSAEVVPDLESEQEAFVRGALYLHRLMGRRPELLSRHAGAAGCGAAAKETFGSALAADYLALCAGRKEYLGAIEKGYAGIPAGPEGPVDGDDPERRAYTAEVNKLIDGSWPGLWRGAALAFGRAALAAGAYPRALRCLVPDAAEAGGYGLPPAELKEVSDEGDRALAAALAFLRAGAPRDYDVYAQTYLAASEAFGRLGRPLPEDVKAMKTSVYARARRHYAAMAAAEKDRLAAACLRYRGGRFAE